jgi:uncharacterized caspase-like protein
VRLRHALVGLVLAVAPASVARAEDPPNSDRGGKVAFAPPPNSPVKERWALIIGIGTYQASSLNLPYADDDAKALEAFLLSKRGGSLKRSNVLTLVDHQATRTGIQTALNDFVGKPAKDDLLLVFFAGHGRAHPRIPRKNYLLPYDTDPANVQGTGMLMGHVMRDITSFAVAERVVVFADACGSAFLFDERERSGPPDLTPELADVEYRPGWATMSAGTHEEKASEGKKWGGGHGVFTHFLLEGLAGKADLKEHKGDGNRPASSSTTCARK